MVGCGIKRGDFEGGVPGVEGVGVGDVVAVRNWIVCGSYREGLR